MKIVHSFFNSIIHSSTNSIIHLSCDWLMWSARDEAGLAALKSLEKNREDSNRIIEDVLEQKSQNEKQQKRKISVIRRKLSAASAAAAAAAAAATAVASSSSGKPFMANSHSFYGTTIQETQRDIDPLSGLEKDSLRDSSEER